MNDLPPPINGEVAALIIADDQYIFRHSENGRQTLKFVSPAAVRAAFNHEPIDSGWLIDGVRRWGISPAGQWCVLFIPAARHTLLFSHDANVFASTEKVVQLTVPLPALVFVGFGSDYYVWALDTDDFQPNATLHHAPLPNVYPDGRICFGANVAPSAERIAQAWQLFSAAPFNGDLASGKSKAQPDDVRVQLRNVVTRHRRRYPRRDLLPLTMTVEQAVNQILRRHE